MWEFSICLKSSNAHIAEFIHKNLKPHVAEVEGVITSFEEAGKIQIILACEEVEKTRLSLYVCQFITEAICTYMKKDYLHNNLNIPIKDKISLTAFEKALLHFDKETDRYLTNKYLLLDKNIHLESFFEFKLKVLKTKWAELIKIANENSGYILSESTFVDLLKFLVDNLEVSSDLINIIYENEHYKILDENFKEIENLEIENFDECMLVETIISLSPRKINIYSNEENGTLKLISSIYDERTTMLPIANKM